MENEPLHLLLADDDDSDRLIFKKALASLKKIKTVVSTVNDGIQLMDYLTRESNDLPDLIFLDLNMPRKNGLECLKEIKAHEKLKNISIAIYSTSDHEKDVEETFLNGANIYLTKPSNFNDLKKALEKAVMTVHLYRNKSMKREFFLLRI